MKRRRDERFLRSDLTWLCGVLGVKAVWREMTDELSMSHASVEEAK